MPLRISIIDGSQGYRSVLATFIRTHWADAEIEDIDPFSQTMRGAGLAFGGKCDVIVLGGLGTRAEALSALERLTRRTEKIAIILLVSHDMQPDIDALKAGGASAVLIKDALSRATLIDTIARSTGLSDAPAPANTGFGQFTFAADSERHVIGIEHFRETDTLAATAMARIFAAERVSDQRRAVVKIAISWPYHNIDMAHHFCERYAFFLSLDGKGVVRYLDAGVAGPWPYVAIEFLTGGDLRERIDKGLSPIEALRHVYHLVTALARIHQGGFVHLDVKPENIMFRPESEGGELLLIDFNISSRNGQVARDRLTGDVLGSPDYMSPEQGSGQTIDARSDLYSVGVILFEMLSGTKPYSAKNTAELIFRHIHDEVPLLPKAVREYQPLIDGLMAKTREERYASSTDVAMALQPFLSASAQ